MKHKADIAQTRIIKCAMMLFCLCLWLKRHLVVEKANNLLNPLARYSATLVVIYYNISV